MILKLRLLWSSLTFGKQRERRYMSLKQRQKRERKLAKKFG